MVWTLGHACFMSFINNLFVFPHRIKIHCTFLKCSDCRKCRNAPTFNLCSAPPSIRTFQILDRWGKEECLQNLHTAGKVCTYLFPISHSKKFHVLLLYYKVNLHDIAQLVSHCEQIGSHCAWLGYEIGGMHCDWLVRHCAGLVSQRIRKLAHIVAEYALRSIDDIATMVGSMFFCKIHVQRSDYCIHPRCKLASCSHVWCTVLQLEQSLSKMHGYINAIHCV